MQIICSFFPGEKEPCLLFIELFSLRCFLKATCNRETTNDLYFKKSKKKLCVGNSTEAVVLNSVEFSVLFQWAFSIFVVYCQIGIYNPTFVTALWQTELVGSEVQVHLIFTCHKRNYFALSWRLERFIIKFCTSNLL